MHIVHTARAIAFRTLLAVVLAPFAATALIAAALFTIGG